MDSDEHQQLWRSLIEEREQLLAHRKALLATLAQIGAFAQASRGRPGKNEAFEHIIAFVEAALKL